MPVVLMPEGVVLSHTLPDWLRLAIADAVVVFGRIEQEAIEIAWLMIDADLEQKLKVARNPARANLTDIIEAVELAAPGLKLGAMKKTIERTVDERNLIVHGSWTMVEGRPWVVWHKFLEDNESIVGENFDKPRFDRFMKVGEQLLATLRQMHDQLENDTGKKTSAIPRDNARAADPK